MPKLPRRMFRRNGVYYWQGVVEGRRHPISLRTRNRDEALRLYRDLERRYLLGDVPQPDVLVRDAVELWLEKDVPARRAGKDQKLARTRADKYFLPRFGGKRLGAVKVAHLEDYRQALEGYGWKPATVTRILHDARRFFNWCVRREYLDRSPFPREFMPKVPEEPIERLTDEELAACRDRLVGDVAWTFRFLLDSGLRWGEAARATIHDVDLNLGQLVVRRSKSGRPRAVPLSPDILAELPERALGHGGKVIPYSEKSSGSFAKAVRRQSGVERFHAHLLRHTYGRLYLEHGGGLKELQQLLGHESMKTTLRYARLSDNAVRSDWERVRTTSELHHLG